MVAVVGSLLTMNGCATTESRLIAAADTKGRVEARIALPDLPADCRRHMTRVTPAAGDKARWIEARWEASADTVDRQIDNCAAFNDDVKARFQKR